MRPATVLLWLFASVGTFSAAAATAAAEAGAGDGSDEAVVRPVKISKSDQAGKIFEGTGVNRSEKDGNVTLDVTTLESSDGRFGSGMYRSGAIRLVVTEPYGVDEFMYFLEGGVTLTSADGSVQVVEAGEAVTIPKEWTGIWETDGYTKIWVIYSADGAALR